MEKRIEEIVNGMTSFTKELYNKSEVLPELLALQSELVNLTFNGTHAEKASLRIWDVEDHLDKLNAECGHVADAEMKRFKDGCKEIINAIKAELSGQAGEYKACRSIETLRCKNVCLRNVEFKHEDHRTELDLIVVTEKAVFIVEVKNPGKDIYIDERGNYCRVTRETLSFDKNIGEKMNEKEYLLRHALESAGIENINIVSFVVFTNSNIQVENRFPYITTCFLSDITHKISDYEGERIYSDEEINKIVEAIDKNECNEEYPMPIDMQEFKKSFATVMSILETAKEKSASAKDTDKVNCQGETAKTKPAEKQKKIANSWLKKNKKAMSYATTAGVAAIGIILGTAIAAHFER